MGLRSSLLSLLLLSACATEPEPLTHTFDTLTIQPGQERTDVCLSWTLGNLEPLFVRQVRSVNGGAFHHSNWFIVSEETYPGPDGAWSCEEREFDTVGAGVSGSVLFAQSTQVTEEIQRFADGAVIAIPPRARIIGQAHLLNYAGAALDTSISLELQLVERDQVEIELRPMAITNLALDIPARAASEFELECDWREPFDFNVYFVLPHYHDLGSSFSLEALGPDGPTPIVDTRTRIGDPLGQVLDPPLAIRGATGARMRCGYENPTDENVRYGFADGEMCVFLAFTDANRRFAGVSRGASTPAGTPGRMRAECLAAALAR